MDDTALEDAFDDLITALADSASFLRSHPFYADDANRASAHSFLLAMLLSRIEEQVIFDPDHPYFRVIDPRTREGGDNSDQRYLVARLNGGDTYRVWGNVGGADRVELQIYAGDPYVIGGDGRMASYLTFEELSTSANGDFEVLASPRPQEGNWLENPADATRMFVRQVYSDWTDEDPGHIHIDRVGHEGDLAQPVTADVLAARLQAATSAITTHATLWPEFVRHRYVEAIPPNEVSPLFDPGAFGGVPGRWMAQGVFDLAVDEALIISTWQAEGNYQGIQLCDMWFSSLEYAGRQTSLTGEQAHLDSDGRYRFVIAARDPGVANWLDSTGRRRGVFLLRYDGTGGAAIDPEAHPTAEKVAFADLATHLPDGTVHCNPDERAEQIARRRRHVQRRFGF